MATNNVYTLVLCRESVGKQSQDTSIYIAGYILNILSLISNGCRPDIYLIGIYTTLERAKGYAELYAKEEWKVLLEDQWEGSTPLTTAEFFVQNFDKQQIKTVFLIVKIPLDRQITVSCR